MQFGQSVYGKATMISLVLHSALLGLLPGTGRLVRAPIAEAVPVEVIPSRLLSIGELGDCGGANEATADGGMQRQSGPSAQQEPAPAAAQLVAEAAPQLESTVHETLPVLQGNSVEPELASLAVAGTLEQTTPQAAAPESGGEVNEVAAALDGRVGVANGPSGQADGADAGLETGNAGGGGGGARLLGGANPQYPAAARKAGWEGTVLARVVIDARGKAAVVSVRQSSGYSLLDEAVRKAVKKWRFAPATQGGIPVASFHDVKVRFRLDEN
jgi:protein TonB